jgi:hypothetical protein
MDTNRSLMFFILNSISISNIRRPVQRGMDRNKKEEEEEKARQRAKDVDILYQISNIAQADIPKEAIPFIIGLLEEGADPESVADGEAIFIIFLPSILTALIQ